MKREVFDSFGEDSTLRTCGLAGCEALERYWTEETYPARSMILSEDEESDAVYFILDGGARAATYTVGGKEVMLSDLARGESFGLLAAIDGQPRSTNVVTLEDSRIARMTAVHFNEVLETNRDVLRANLRYLVKLVRSLSARMTHATTLNSEQRLIAELLRLARSADANNGTGVVDPLPTQHELATVIFSQRETVSRDLSKLKDAGLVRRDGRVLTIRSLGALRARLEA